MSGSSFRGGQDVPTGWQGRTEPMPGRLVVDEHEPQDGVAGTFTTDDGVVIPVQGGREGEYMFTLGCAIWPPA